MTGMFEEKLRVLRTETHALRELLSKIEAHISSGSIQDILFYKSRINSALDRVEGLKRLADDCFVAVALEHEAFFLAHQNPVDGERKQ